MLAGSSQFVSVLRQELIGRKGSYAVLNRLPHATSYGELPVVVYQQSVRATTWTALLERQARGAADRVR
jgi:hypothetical protein